MRRGPTLHAPDWRFAPSQRAVVAGECILQATRPSSLSERTFLEQNSRHIRGRISGSTPYIGPRPGYSDKLLAQFAPAGDAQPLGRLFSIPTLLRFINMLLSPRPFGSRLVVRLGVIALNSGQLGWQFTQCVTRRTVSCSSGSSARGLL